MRKHLSSTLEYCFNPNDRGRVAIHLLLPADLVSRIEAAMERWPNQSIAEFVENAVLYAMMSLDEDAAAIWVC